MSTNYYWRTNVCACCNRYDEKHIGKTAGGWQFSFRGYRDAEYTGNPEDDIVSWEDWKARLRTTGLVFDEYGAPIEVEDFIAMVDNDFSPGKTWGSRPLLNHIDEMLNNPQYAYCREAYLDSSINWKDEKGFSFSLREFC